ncbi:MAG: CHASE2 domain-containing protein [Raineya sp.]|jgi:CHASE2 domain-containing sensor protein|nr:CHASE2 domain-containing protein [Raineya sp.]
MRTFFRFFFNKDNILILAFTAVVAFIVQSINLNLDALNPMEKMFGDFDITDVYFHGIRNVKEDFKDDKASEKALDLKSAIANDDIVVVGIGKLSRQDLIPLLEIVKAQKPKCIGIDALFKRFRTDSLNAPIDSAFGKTLQNIENLVMVTEISFTQKTNNKIINNQIEEPQFDSLITSHPFFIQNAKGGLANLITGGTRDKALRSDLVGGLATCRSFSPKETVSGKTELAFAVQLAMLYAPQKAEKFLKRKNNVEFINYIGHHEKFGYLSYQQLFEMDEAGAKEELKRLLHNKIVLMGFTGEDTNIMNVTSDEDRFFTPLNENYVGKAEKDMYGIHVHANILSMILKEEYIDQMPDWANYLITFIIAYLITALFVFLYAKLDFWYDGLSLLVQFLLSISVVFAILQVFDKFKMKVDWSLGFLAIVFIPNLVEVYYGAVTKLYERRQRLRRLKNKQIATLGVEEQS